MVCRGICPKYKATGSPNKGRYSNGQKRCIPCDIFLDPKGIAQKLTGTFCLCCGSRVRTKPRNKKYKDKHKERMKNKQRILIKTPLTNVREQ